MIRRALPLVPTALFASILLVGATGEGAKAFELPTSAAESAVLATPGLSPAAFSAFSAAARTHDPGQSYLYLRVYDDSLIVRVEMAVADVERVLGLGWDPNDVSAADVAAQAERIRAYVEPKVALAALGSGLPLRFRESGLLDLNTSDYATLTYVAEGWTGIPDEIDVEFTVVFEVDSDHRNMLIIEHNWKTATFNNEGNVSLIFSPRNSRQTLDLTSSSVLRGFIGFIWLGVWHILIGFDHILFLMALVLPAVLQRRDGKWEPVPDFRRGLVKIVTIVTFFTIAHSVTLSLAALDVVRLPSRFVESVIAASIAAAALANLTAKLNVREWAIAFAFGLFHGFGFATVLGDIGMGREYLVLSLLGFNIGVELGQIAIICLAFPILFALRRTAAYRWIRVVGSLLLIGIALYWLAERALGIDIPLVPGPLQSLFGS
jgi:hydrogenase/urease accessory protein HupE